MNKLKNILGLFLSISSIAYACDMKKYLNLYNLLYVMDYKQDDISKFPDFFQKQLCNLGYLPKTVDLYEKFFKEASSQLNQYLENVKSFTDQNPKKNLDTNEKKKNFEEQIQSYFKTFDIKINRGRKTSKSTVCNQDLWRKFYGCSNKATHGFLDTLLNLDPNVSLILSNTPEQAPQAQANFTFITYLVTNQSTLKSLWQDVKDAYETLPKAMKGVDQTQEYTKDEVNEKFLLKISHFWHEILSVFTQVIISINNRFAWVDASDFSKNQNLTGHLPIDLEIAFLELKPQHITFPVGYPDFLQTAQEKLMSEKYLIAQQNIGGEASPVLKKVKNQTSKVLQNMCSEGYKQSQALYRKNQKQWFDTNPNLIDTTAQKAINTIAQHIIKINNQETTYFIEFLTKLNKNELADMIKEMSDLQKNKSDPKITACFQQYCALKLSEDQLQKDSPIRENMLKCVEQKKLFFKKEAQQTMATIYNALKKLKDDPFKSMIVSEFHRSQMPLSFYYPPVFTQCTNCTICKPEQE